MAAYIRVENTSDYRMESQVQATSKEKGFSLH